MSRSTRSIVAVAACVTLFGIGACERSGTDTAAAPIEASRAVAPSVPVVAADSESWIDGRFTPGESSAQTATGVITITDGRIVGENGASFETVVMGRIKADETFGNGANASTYADVLGVDSSSSVELRRVTVETPPTDAMQAICGTEAVAVFALAKRPRTGGETLKVAALRSAGGGTAASTELSLCESTQYVR